VTFPHYFEIFGLRIHPHPAMETIAYIVGFQAYLLNRRKERSRIVGVEHSLWIIVGAVFGALLGSKLLAWMESPHEFWAMRHDLQLLMGGKTLVGGLLGGWIGVEIAKWFMGIRARTGDACVLPLMLGIAIGRIGCFLTGLDDRTYGTASSLPWTVDFGDGVARHPTQLYESGFVLLGGSIIHFSLNRTREGSRFRIFLIAYLSFRFAVEFIKPTYRPFMSMSAIQMACLAGLIAAIWQLFEVPKPAIAVHSADKGSTSS